MGGAAVLLFDWNKSRDGTLGVDTHDKRRIPHILDIILCLLLQKSKALTGLGKAFLICQVTIKSSEALR